MSAVGSAVQRGRMVARRGCRRGGALSCSQSHGQRSGGDVSSLMLQEAREAPARVAALLRPDATAIAALADRLRAPAARSRPPSRAAAPTTPRPTPRACSAIARGLADRLAAALADHPLRRHARASSARWRSRSRSRAPSPDLVATLRGGGRGGRVHRGDRQRRRLAAGRGRGASCCRSAPGPEQSVAATKSFIASLVAWRAWSRSGGGDRTLLAALERLPERLEAALACDWSAALPVLAPAAQPLRGRPRPRPRHRRTRARSSSRRPRRCTPRR